MTRFETAVLLLLLAILRRLETSAVGLGLNDANQGREERAKQFAANLINEISL